MGAGILGVPDFAVVGSGPDESFLNGGGSDGEHDLAIKLAQIIADDPAGRLNVFGILRGKVGADDAPALASVGGAENHLAAVIDGVVIEGVDGHGGGPVAAVFGIVRR